MHADMSLIPFLSIGLTAPPSDNSRGMSSFLNPISNYLHTNFKLSADGELLTLHHSNGQLIDQMDTGRLLTDISCGRQPDGSATWLYFNQPTPDEANTMPGYQHIGGDPGFSHPSGFYGQGFLLTIIPGTPTTVQLSGTSRLMIVVTAPTFTLLPTWIGPRRVALVPIKTLSPIVGWRLNLWCPVPPNVTP